MLVNRYHSIQIYAVGSSDGYLVLLLSLETTSS